MYIEDTDQSPKYCIVTGKKARYRSVVCSSVLKVCVWYTFLYKETGQIAIINMLL